MHCILLLLHWECLCSILDWNVFHHSSLFLLYQHWRVTFCWFLNLLFKLSSSEFIARNKVFRANGNVWMWVNPSPIIFTHIEYRAQKPFLTFNIVTNFCCRYSKSENWMKELRWMTQFFNDDVTFDMRKT